MPAFAATGAALGRDGFGMGFGGVSSVRSITTGLSASCKAGDVVVAVVYLDVGGGPKG